MKLKFLVFAFCLLALLGACRRGSRTEGNSTPAVVTETSAGDRTQARSLLDKGNELYRNDHDSEAAEAFLQAVKLDPDLPEAHFRLALSYEALNKQQEAESEYKKAVDTYKKYLVDNSKDGDAHYYFGQAYAGLHLYTEAVREYRQATKLKPDDADIYFDLGTAFMKLAQYDEAVGAFSKSVEIDPENYRASDALEEARDGVKRVRAGKKHQEDLLKKQKHDDLKNSNQAGQPGAPGTKATPPKKPQ